MAIEVDLHMPRNAFTPRDAARAGDVWRTCQDVAVLGASALGWDPVRFRDHGAAFVVREMTTVHHGEARYGDVVRGRTWISDFRRGLLTRRQIRLSVGGAPLASATQEWAHVSTKEGVMRASRASAELVADFPVEEPDDSVQLPEFEAAPGPEHVFRFELWHTWMDPLAHANHPAYVDWSEEALARLLSAAGGDPVQVQPVAERARWRVGASAPDTVSVTTQALGRTAAGDVVCRHQIAADKTGHAATVTTVRRLLGGESDLLWRALL